MTGPLALLGRTMKFDRHSNCTEDNRAVLEVVDRYANGDIEIGLLNKGHKENDFYIRLSLPELVRLAMLQPITKEDE